MLVILFCKPHTLFSFSLERFSISISFQQPTIFLISDQLFIPQKGRQILMKATKKRIQLGRLIPSRLPKMEISQFISAAFVVND
jgi:hypothetical protein